MKKPKEDMPKITIITVVYNAFKQNRKKSLERCILSVAKQSYKNKEHIVMDGNSDDGTVKLLEKYKNKGFIEYFSKPDKGIYDAMNNGIQKANGEYLLFLNSDDYLMSNALNNIFNNKDFNNQELILSGVRIVDPKTNNKNHTLYPPIINDSIYLNMYSHQGIIYKKSLHDTFGLYSNEYSIISDWDFLLKVYESKKYKFEKFYNAVSSFSTGGVSEKENEKLICEKKKLIKNYLGVNNEEDLNFLSVICWKNTDEINKYFKNKDINKYSKKQLSTLKDLIQKKQFESGKKNEIPLTDNGKAINQDSAYFENFNNHFFSFYKTEDEADLYVLAGSFKDFMLQDKKNKLFIICDEINKREYLLNLYKNNLCTEILNTDEFIEKIKNIKKLVYISPNHYILKSPDELFNIDIKEKNFACTKGSLKSGKGDFIIFDLEKEKSFNILKMLLKNKEFKPKKKDAYIIDEGWNFCNTYDSCGKKRYKTKQEKDNYYFNECNIKIINFVVKPWEKNCINSAFSEIYFSKIKDSIYENDIFNQISKYYKVEIKIYKLFNLVPLFKIKKQYEGKRIRFYLFSCLPVYTYAAREIYK